MQAAFRRARLRSSNGTGWLRLGARFEQRDRRRHARDMPKKPGQPRGSGFSDRAQPGEEPARRNVFWPAKFDGGGSSPESGRNPRFWEKKSGSKWLVLTPFSVVLAA